MPSPGSRSSALLPRRIGTVHEPTGVPLCGAGAVVVTYGVGTDGGGLPVVGREPDHNDLIEELVEDRVMVRQMKKSRPKGPQRDLLAITLHRPGAQALIHGTMRIMMKAWTPGWGLIGCWVAIHAGRQWQQDDAQWMTENCQRLNWAPPPEEACQTGIIGVALYEHAVNGSRSPWWAPWLGAYGWVFSRVVPFPEPIPCRGQRKLWPVQGDLLMSCRRGWKGACK